MKAEIEFAVDFVASILAGVLNTTSDQHSEKMETFKKAFAEKLESKLKGHWYEDNPSRGEAYRCMFAPLNDSCDGMVSDALSSAAISCQEFVEVMSFLTIWIDPGEVSYQVECRGTGCRLVAKRDRGTKKLILFDTNFAKIIADSKFCREEFKRRDKILQNLINQDPTSNTVPQLLETQHQSKNDIPVNWGTSSPPSNDLLLQTGAIGNYGNILQVNNSSPDTNAYQQHDRYQHQFKSYTVHSPLFNENISPTTITDSSYDRNTAMSSPCSSRFLSNQQTPRFLPLPTPLKCSNLNIMNQHHHHHHRKLPPSMQPMQNRCPQQQSRKSLIDMPATMALTVTTTTNPTAVSSSEQSPAASRSKTVVKQASKADYAGASNAGSSSANSHTAALSVSNNTPASTTTTTTKGYCGYVESYPYYYKLSKLHKALAMQKLLDRELKRQIMASNHAILLDQYAVTGGDQQHFNSPVRRPRTTPFNLSDQVSGMLMNSAGRISSPVAPAGDRLMNMGAGVGNTAHGKSFYASRS